MACLNTFSKVTVSDSVSEAVITSEWHWFRSDSTLPEPALSLGFWNLLPPVIEKAWLVGLHYDNIEQVPPVFTNNVVHASISTIKTLKDFIWKEHFIWAECDMCFYVHWCVLWLSILYLVRTYTKSNGLFVIKNIFFPFLDSFCKTACVCSP